MRPPFLDDLSTAQAGHGTRARGPFRGTGATAGGHVISHEMSREYVLEYPVDDPDEDDDDDLEDDEDDEDEDADEEDPETWQVSGFETVPLKAGLSLTSATELA